MVKVNEDHLYSQLVKLGDMMGDGLHLEPDGKWISKEYTRTCRALGLLPKKKRRNNSEAIDKAMIDAVARMKCPKCSDSFKQTRSGSMRAVCVGCGGKYILLKRGKKRGK